MVEIGVGTIYLIGMALGFGYLYLWFYNTEQAMRITVVVFEMLWKLLMLIGKGLANVISWIFNLLYKKRR
jgi:hypothetical protein